MRTKLLFLFIFLIGLTCLSQNTYVPDDNFEQYLIDNGYDSGSLDDYVPTANINTVTELNVAFRDIIDLTGIEDFSGLVTLDCSMNNLSSLDISNNYDLTSLSCWSNQLTDLDVSQNSSLITLACNSNQLTSLDVINNINLTTLDCSSNNLSTLNLGALSSLTGLNCSYNNLSNLDLNGLTALINLNCEYNSLTTLGSSNNSYLTTLYCYHNSLNSLDVSNNTNLTHLYCYNNNLISIDLSNNINLTNLLCRYNSLTSLDLSANTSLTYLICNSNNLDNLNVKNGNNINFTQFQAQSNPNLTCINVDDAAWSTANWTYVDPASSFSEDCAALSIYDLEVSSFEVFPNPVSYKLTINLNKVANYYLIDLNGQVVRSGKFGHGKNELNVSNISNGLYFLKVKTDEGIITKKFIKQ